MKIALLGYGKMGKAIEVEALAKGHEIVMKANSQWTLFTNPKPEVAIEFSRPESAFENLKRCFEHGVPVVCGTTGWLENWSEAVELCNKNEGSLLYAPNFSIGVNLFFALNQTLAHWMCQYPEYVPGVFEAHHIQKLDKPSGTAVALLNQLLRALNGYSNWSLNKPEANEIGVEVLRSGEITGTHIVRYKGPFDEIEITHKAHSRRGFALGALMAAEWLVNKTGIYAMEDLLNLKK